MLAVLRRAFRGPRHYHLAYMFTQRMRFWAASQISFRCEGLHIRYNVRLVLAQNGFFQLCDFGISNIDFSMRVVSQIKHTCA